MDVFSRPWSDSGCILKGTESTSQVATLACIWPLLSNLINIAIMLSGMVALVFIIWSGIRMISANGDAEQLSAAKKTLTFAIIGFIFILVSFTLFNGVFSILGVDQNAVMPDPDGGVIVEPTP